VRIAALMKFLLIAVIGTAIFVSDGALADEKELPFKVDAPTARRLVLEAIGPQLSDLLIYDGDPLDAYDNEGNRTRTIPGRSMSPPFLTFTGVSRPPAEGFFGFYAVDPWTGDVWELRHCERLSTLTLRQSQAEIRERFTPEERKRYAKLRNHLRLRCF